MQGKIFVDATKAGNEMVFECANCTFGSIASMEPRRHMLIVDGFVDEKLFKRSGALVVEALELGAQTCGDEPCMQPFIASQDARAGTTSQRFDENTVAIVIKEHKDVVVAAGGRDDKFTSLVGVDLPSGGFADCSETMVCALVR